MKVIVITSEDKLQNEAELISRLIEGGIDYVHIRKPKWSLKEVRELLYDIPTRYHKKLRLHDHFSLLYEFELAGVQLNSRNDESPSVGTTCRSCHSINEIMESDRYCYVTLSPIYDSISKQGYKSAFRINDLSNILKYKRVVALGGVEPSRFVELKKYGFWGVALLGWLWKDITLNNIDLKIKEINKNRELLCYNL